MTMKKKKITITLKNDLAELRNLCRYCEKIGKSIGLSEKLIFQTNLALDELFTNIVTYGFKDQKEHQVILTIILDRDALEFHIEDDGIPFDPVNIPGPEQNCSLNDTRVGGLGIHLIKSLMDEITYHRINGKNVLELKKYIDATTGQKVKRARCFCRQKASD
jgi:anti-sigma regulatory factor (Ser/Thr protein kinase)